MSSEEKESFRLVLEELKSLRASVEGAREDLRGLQIAVVEHTADEERRFERIEATLVAHQSRLKGIEDSVRASRLNGGRPL